MKEFKYTINGNKYEVAVGEVQGNNVEITVNGEKYCVELEPKQEKERVKVQAPVAPKKVAAPTAPGTVAGDPLKAPLPGTIKDICVNVGDEVKEGQPVVILEAMKMANNLEAERDGKIAAIHVNIGDTVMEGTALVTIE